VKGFARSAVKGFLAAAGGDLGGWKDIKAAEPHKGEGSSDLSELMRKSLKGQWKLTRLWLERFPLAIESKKGARPVSMHENETAVREKQVREPKAARAETGTRRE
jgi:hypothetical protein